MPRHLRAFLGIVLVVMGLTTGASADSWNDAVAEAKRRKTVVLVEFNAVWCGPCKRFERDVLPQRSVQASLAKVVFSRIDFDSEEGQRLANRYAINAVPSFLVVAPDGTVKDLRAGAIGLDNPDVFAEYVDGVWARFAPEVADRESAELWLLRALHAVATGELWQARVWVDRAKHANALRGEQATRLATLDGKLAFIAHQVKSYASQIQVARTQKDASFALAFAVLSHSMSAGQERALLLGQLAKAPTAEMLRSIAYVAAAAEFHDIAEQALVAYLDLDPSPEMALLTSAEIAASAGRRVIADRKALRCVELARQGSVRARCRRVAETGVPSAVLSLRVSIRSRVWKVLRDAGLVSSMPVPEYQIAMRARLAHGWVRKESVSPGRGFAAVFAGFSGAADFAGTRLAARGYFSPSSARQLRFLLAARGDALVYRNGEFAGEAALSAGYIVEFTRFAFHATVGVGAIAPPTRDYKALTIPLEIAVQPRSRLMAQIWLRSNFAFGNAELREDTDQGAVGVSAGAILGRRRGFQLTAQFEQWPGASSASLLFGVGGYR